MRKVISNNELKDKIISAISLLCDAVSSTLGPTGNNIIINNGEIDPFITNDGVTIASVIESDDNIVNTILQIAKEAALKTNELVGDGTTTTLVLMKSIIVEGFNTNKNKIILKNELNNSLEKILSELDKLKIKPSKEDLINIASISSNDRKIGELLAKIYFKTNNNYSINLKEGNKEETYYETKKGYSVEIDNNPYLFNSEEITINDVYIITLNNYIESIEDISELINESIINNKNVVIFSNGYSDDVKNNILYFNLHNKKNIYIFNIPDYGLKKQEILNDIEVITNSKLIDLNYDYVSFDNKISKVIIKKEEIILFSNNKTTNYLDKLKMKLDNTDDQYEKDFLKERIAAFENGITTIFVGGRTKTEIREKLMRYEDAINAIEIAKNGIVIGEGITFLNVSKILNEETDGEKILKEALKQPFIKIMENLGLNYKDYIDQIKKDNYKKIYNYKTNRLEITKKVIDPVEVLKTAIKNAVSISTMLLTTNYLVLNEKNNLKEEL